MADKEWVSSRVSERRTVLVVSTRVTWDNVLVGLQSSLKVFPSADDASIGIEQELWESSSWKP